MQSQLPFHQIVEKFLFEPQSGDAPGLSAAVDFLNKLECIGIDVLAQIVPSTLGKIGCEKRKVSRVPAAKVIDIAI